METRPQLLIQDWQLEAFAQALARGRAALPAALSAGIDCDQSQADALFRDASVSARVLMIRREIVASTPAPTRQELLRDAAELYSRAQQGGDVRVALQALRLRAELAGELDGTKPAARDVPASADELRRDIEARAKALGLRIARS